MAFIQITESNPELMLEGVQRPVIDYGIAMPSSPRQRTTRLL